MNIVWSWGGDTVILLHKTLKDSLPPELLQQAAELLGLSAGSLKRVCRKLGLARWPFRVRKSLRAVIAKTEEFMVRPVVFARLHWALSGAGAHCCTLQDDAEAGDSKLEVLQSLKAQMEDVKVTACPEHSSPDLSQYLHPLREAATLLLAHPVEYLRSRY